MLLLQQLGDRNNGNVTERPRAQMKDAQAGEEYLALCRMRQTLIDGKALEQQVLIEHQRVGMQGGVSEA